MILQAEEPRPASVDVGGPSSLEVQRCRQAAASINRRRDRRRSHTWIMISSLYRHILSYDSIHTYIKTYHFISDHMVEAKASRVPPC